jgi:hypothetical protein
VGEAEEVVELEEGVDEARRGHEAALGQHPQHVAQSDSMHLFLLLHFPRVGSNFDLKLTSHTKSRRKKLFRRSEIFLPIRFSL